MRAPRAKPSSEIVDLALERTGRSRSVDVINSGKLRLASRAPGAGKTPARQKPIAERREGRPRRTGNGRSGSIAEATGAPRTNLAEMRLELAGVRDQMGELEAETGRLRAQLFRLTQERHDTERGSLEFSLRSLGEELGNALAERSAADLRAERTAHAMEKLSEELVAAAAARDGLADAWAKLTESLVVIRGELTAAEARAERAAHDSAAITAQLEAVSAERDRARAEARQLADNLMLLEGQVTLASNHLVERDELRARFINLAARLLGSEVLPSMNELDVLAKLRERVRRLERALDHEQAVGQRVVALATAGPRSASGVLTRFVRDWVGKGRRGSLTRTSTGAA